MKCTSFARLAKAVLKPLSNNIRVYEAYQLVVNFLIRTLRTSFKLYYVAFPLGSRLTLKDLLVIGRQYEAVNNKTQKVRTVLRTITIHAKRQPLMHIARHRTLMENCNPDTHFAEIVWANGHIKKGNVQREVKSVVSVLNTTILHACVVPRDKDEVKVQPKDVTKQTFNLLTLRTLMITANQKTKTVRYCYAVKNKQCWNPVTKLTINNCKVKFTVDTGSSINVIDQQTYNKLGKIKLAKTSIRAITFNSADSVKMTGKFINTVESMRKITVATIYVTEANGGCLLSAETAEELGLISLHLNTVHTPPQQAHPQFATVRDKGVKAIVQNHAKVISGLGRMKHHQVELIVDEDVTPVAQEQRRIPFHLRAKVDNELNRLLEQDIIERMPDTEATEWISNSNSRLLGIQGVKLYILMAPSWRLVKANIRYSFKV